MESLEQMHEQVTLFGKAAKPNHSYHLLVYLLLQIGDEGTLPENIDVGLEDFSRWSRAFSIGSGMSLRDRPESL